MGEEAATVGGAVFTTIGAGAEGLAGTGEEHVFWLWYRPYSGLVGPLTSAMGSGVFD
jgi:hypothetical protein